MKLLFVFRASAKEIRIILEEHFFKIFKILFLFLISNSKYKFLVYNYDFSGCCVKPMFPMWPVSETPTVQVSIYTEIFL